MNRRDLPVYRWMQKHGRSEVSIRVLEYCPPDDYSYLDFAEQYWISSLTELGFDLLNIEYGGRGGRRKEVSLETKAKLSVASKRGWNKYPDRFKGVPKSDAWKAKASERWLGDRNPQFGAVWSAERRASHGEAIRAGILHRDKHSPTNVVEGCKNCMKGKF